MRIARGYVFSLGLLLPACGGGQVAPAESAPSATEVDAGQFPPVAATDAGLSDASATGNPPPVLDNDGGRVKGRAHDPGRSSQDIRALVVAHRDEARACYDNALATHPGIEGDLVMRWTIDPKGVVGQIANDTARSQIFEPSLVSCVAAVLGKIQFAPSQRGFETTAFYPFNFHPRRSPTPTPP